MLFTLLGIGGMVFIIFLSLIFLIYIITAIGLCTLAKTNGYDDLSFLAYIPVANNYLFAIMGGDSEIFGAIKVRDKYMGIILIILSIINITSKKSNLWILLIFLIFSYYAYFNLYKKIDYQNAKAFAICSLIIPFFAPIYIFIKRYTIFSDDYNIIE